jgi:hypothetical protein
MLAAKFIIRPTLASLLLCLVLQAACFSSDGQLQGEITAYDQGNFDSAVTIGHRVLRTSPDNALAHYYLANAYAKLNRRQEAYEEYAACTRLATDPTMKRYAEEGLSALGTNKQGDSTGSCQSEMAKVVTLRQAELQRDDRLRMLQTDLDSQTRQLYAGARQQVTDLSTRFKNEPVINYSHHGRRASYHYNQNLYRNKQQEDQAAAIMEDTRMRVRTEENEMQALAAAREADLRNEVANTASQLQPGPASGIQLSPIGTNLYVKNFVNYGGEPLEPQPIAPLKAVAGSLDQLDRRNISLAKQLEKERNSDSSQKP